MMLTIEKKRNGEHVFAGKEFSEEYNLENKTLNRMAFEQVNEAFRDFETTWTRDYEEQDAIYEKIPGEYIIDEGDYTYTITIRDNPEDIEKI